MLVSASKLINTPILSLQASGEIARISDCIVDPNALKILGFKVASPLISTNNILDTKSIREYSSLGAVIDSIDELVEPGDIIKISKVLELNFSLVGLKVETKKGTHLGRISDFTVTEDNFSIQQIIVKRPLIKSFIDPELTIPRHEIIEITDYKVIVKDEEKVIRARASKEDFIPNFVNPFRKSELSRAPARTKNPADIDTE